MRNYVAAVNNDCNALVLAINAASEKFSSTSQEVAAKHHGSVNTLCNTIHSYASAEKDLFDNVKSNTNKIVEDQKQMHQRMGETLQSAVMAKLKEVFEAEMQKVQEKLETGA